jgi:hypothetical protein
MVNYNVLNPYFYVFYTKTVDNLREQIIILILYVKVKGNGTPHNYYM